MSLSDKMEAFIITNGRKTFDHAKKMIDGQSLSMKITVLRDMKWIDALNEINRLCTSEFYLRIDDDMFLHWLAAEYMAKKVAQTSTNTAFYMCHLYEPATKSIVRGIKAYRTSAAREIGYEVDKFGKIDKIFLKKCRKKKFKIKIDDSIVGVHGTSDIEDEKKYQQLWANNSSVSFRRDLAKCKQSIEEQVKMAGKFIGKMNIRSNEEFGSFIRNK